MNDSEKLAQVRGILQAWLDKQGHERCWYYPDLFRQLAGVVGVAAKLEPALPPLEEFQEGCRRYQLEEFSTKEKDEAVLVGQARLPVQRV